MAEHPGQEFLDMAFGPREVERLEAIDEAKRRPGSVWYENPKLWDGTLGLSEALSEVDGGVVEPSRSGTGVRGRSVSRTGLPSCGCCGREFAGRRSDAVFCGPVCQKRSRRGRCEEAVS